MKRTMMFAAIAVATLAVQANPPQVSNGVMASKESKTLYAKKSSAAPDSGYSAGYNYN